jgi:hypothetical protein
MLLILSHGETVSGAACGEARDLRDLAAGNLLRDDRDTNHPDLDAPCGQPFVLTGKTWKLHQQFNPTILQLGGVV